jgi:hypothetical protein
MSRLFAVATVPVMRHPRPVRRRVVVLVVDQLNSVALRVHVMAKVVALLLVHVRMLSVMLVETKMIRSILLRIPKNVSVSRML